MVTLCGFTSQDGSRDSAQPRAAHPVRGEAAQVDSVGDRQAVVVAEPLGVRVHADADEANAAVAEECRQRARDAVGVEELED